MPFGAYTVGKGATLAIPTILGAIRPGRAISSPGGTFTGTVESVESDLTEAFAALVAPADGSVDVEAGAWLIAAHAEPDLDLALARQTIDDLAGGVSDPSLAGLRRHLFVDLGFGGDGVNFADPRNSFLDQVIARRSGLPIALSVLTIAVGRRLGVRLHGVGLPGHFIVGVEGHDIFVDPFHGGALLDEGGCIDLHRRMAGPDAPFDHAWLAPSPPRAILARMLANLKNVYLATGDADGALWVTRLRTRIPGLPPIEHAHLAALLEGRGESRAAAGELERMAEMLPADPAGRARRKAALLRASLN